MDDSFKIKKSLNIEPRSGLSLDQDGDITVDSADNKLKVRLNGATDPVVTEAGTATLTNKTLTSPTVDVATLDGQGSTPSSPSAGFYKLYVDDTTSKLQLLDSSGTVTTVGSGAGGGINYIENPDAEAATTGWATYADAAGTSPVDGTGGAANITWTRSTSSPLRGLASFLLTKGAADRQGEGASYDFTIDLADQAKVMQIGFDYAVASGTYATGDLAIYIVDVTNSTVIQPSAYQVENVGVNSTARLTFQTASNSTSYRLCFHVASTSASAYSLKFDNIQLGPQVVPLGAPVTDWVSYTPTFTALGTPTGVSVESRRIGDSLHVKGVFTVSSGSPSEARISLGYAGVNNNVTTSAFGAIRIAGHATFSSNSAVSPEILAEQSVGYLTFGQQGSANAGLTKLNGTVLVTTISFYAQVPIVGWSSSTAVSSSADTRVVTCRATRSATQTGVNPNNSAVKVTFNTANDDTVGGFDTVNSRYVVKVPGKYRLSGSVYTSGTNVLANTYYTVLYVNGAAVKNGPPITASAGNPTGGSVDWIGQLAAGDYVELFLFGVGNNSVNTLSVFGGINSSLDVELVQGPSQIAASEIVSMVCYKNTGSHTSTGNFQDVASWNAVTQDTHGGFNTTTGVYTCPAPGTYVVRSKVGFATNSTGFRQLQIVRDGSAVSYSPDVTGAVSSAVQGYTVIPNCVAGTLIKVQAYQNSGGNLAYSTSANFTELSIYRLGGV